MKHAKKKIFKNISFDKYVENISLDQHLLQLSETSKYIVTYIADFVVKHLLKTINCDECKNALTTEDDFSATLGLIRRKNRGNLTLSSKDVIKICRMSETVVREALNESG